MGTISKNKTAKLKKIKAKSAKSPFFMPNFSFKAFFRANIQGIFVNFVIFHFINFVLLLYNKGILYVCMYVCCEGLVQ